MKLELKHLAPYLPYKLSIKREGYEHKNLFLLGIEFNDVLHQLGKTPILFIKPIFRPISDLDKEIVHEGKTFIPHLILGGRPNLKDYDLKYFQNNATSLSYNIVQQLLEWHFDIFNLIEAGLAISIHDVKQVVA